MAALTASRKEATSLSIPHLVIGVRMHVLQWICVVIGGWLIGFVIRGGTDGLRKYIRTRW